MDFIHLYLGLLITIKATVCSDNSRTIKEEKLKGGIIGYIAGNNFFIIKEELPPPMKKLKFSYIVVKHGMVVPEVTPQTASSYPSDPLYQFDWQPGMATTRGRSLMLMVGRSLKTRYHEFLKETKSWDDIIVSSISKEYAIKLTAQLAFGLFQGTGHDKKLNSVLNNWVMTEHNNKKMEKLSTVNAECRWLGILRDMYQKEVKEGSVRLTRCTENLYQQLREFIKIDDEKQREWLIDSPSRVYKLWSMLVFEIMQGQKEPRWIAQKWSQIQSCVFEDHRTLYSYHPAIPAVVPGRMIHQMEEELNGGRHKFHVHVTNDIGAVALNWTLPNSKRDYWPDPGDAIMFDFFDDDTVQVSSFSGWQRTFDLIYKSTTEEFFNEYKKRNIHTSVEAWDKICAHDGAAPAPDGIDPSLFALPVKREMGTNDQVEGTKGEKETKSVEEAEDVSRKEAKDVEASNKEVETGDANNKQVESVAENSNKEVKTGEDANDDKEVKSTEGKKSQSLRSFLNM